MSGRGRLTLAERLALEAALDVAFAPLRAQRAGLSPTRVRAAVRWGRGKAPDPVPWAGAVARLSELSLAVGMSAVVFVAALGSAPLADPPAARTIDEAEIVEHFAVPRVTVPLEGERYIRWLKLDRDVSLADLLDASISPAGDTAEAGVSEPVAIQGVPR